MRGTFQIKGIVAGFICEATVSGYDDSGDYYNPPSSESVVEEISLWDEETNSAVQYETLDDKTKAKIDSELDELFLKTLHENDCGPDEYEGF